MATSGLSGDLSVSVQIINFNSGRLLSRCLDALAQQTVRGFRVIVVDNDSADDSARDVETRYENVTLVQARSNLGFAAGNNLALKHAQGAEWVALLNPDAFPEPDWLERLILAARASPEFSFFGCRMFLADTPEYLDGTGDVYHTSGMAWRRDHGAPVERSVTRSDEIFGPCAAAALYSRHALEEVGGFDERYFCYHEDVDLAFRLRLRGHRCRYVPEAVVYHVSSGIAGRRSDFATYHGHRNLVWTYVKDMPTALFWVFLPAHLVLNLASILMLGLRGQLGVALRAKRDAIAGLGDALRERRAIQASRKATTLSILAVMQIGWTRR